MAKKVNEPPCPLNFLNRVVLYKGKGRISTKISSLIIFDVMHGSWIFHSGFPCSIASIVPLPYNFAMLINGRTHYLDY